jgi:hypothetical protein
MLTGKTISQLNILNTPTPDTAIPVELTGSTYHITYSSIEDSITNTTNNLSSSVAGTTNDLSSSIDFLSSSIATTDYNQEQRLDSIEGVSGSYATTGSNEFYGDQYISGAVYLSDGVNYGAIALVPIMSSSGFRLYDNLSGDLVIGSPSSDITLFTYFNDYQNEGDTVEVSLTRSGSLDVYANMMVTGSVIIGTGSLQVDGHEILHVENSGSINIAHFDGNNQYYTQINVKNSNSGNNSSTDIVVTADNGNETIHYVDLGINSSGNDGGGIGFANDAYLLNSGKDLYIGTLGGSEHPAELKLFAMGKWDDPQMIIHDNNKVSFNTSSVSYGYEFEFSGSVKLDNNLLVSGGITGSLDYSNLINVPDFVLTSSLNDVSSSLGEISSSFSDSLNSLSSSYATTGSNTFKSGQVISGSVTITDNLTVLGSSSITYISQSILNIASNMVTVNAVNPSVRFGGLAVIDSGSNPTVSGSLLFDSIENQWIYVHQNTAVITSSLLIMGPESYDSVGYEIHPTTNRLMKSVNDEHIGDSNITDDGIKVSINSNTEVTGSLKITLGDLYINGTSYTAATSGTSGTSGSSGATGQNGTSGTSGSSGTRGTSGTSGSSGTRGSSGTSGSSGLRGGVLYNFSNSTTNSDPGSGNVKYNSGQGGEGGGTISSVTSIYIDNLSLLGNDLTAWISTFNDSTSTNKGTLTLMSAGSGTTVNIFAVNSVTNNSGYHTIGVTYLSGSIPSNNEDLVISFSATGNVGNNGANGTSGTSGSSGTRGTSGTSGSSGAAGANGQNGTSGSSGSAGTSGTSPSANATYTVVTPTTNYTGLTTDVVILANPANTGMSVTLPTAIGNTGKIFYIKNITTTNGRTVTVNTTGGQTIDGAANISLGIMGSGSGSSYTLVSNGSNWYVLTQH